MSGLRAVLATIQQAHPEAFCRIDDIDGDDPAASEEELAQLKCQVADGLPDQLRCAGIGLRCARSPGGLAGQPGPDEGGELAGQVALVTGAASGLGLGIARGLHAAGACVVFTDVDRDGLRSVAASIDDPLRALTQEMNVTDEASVATGFDAALRHFGRLDILVCAAGIAPPYELVDFPVDRFRLALEINLTGYFLCAREAARIMRAQGHGGAMVMLSSKSGIEPSKANSAYNATKAGELHLARGWALELGVDGIRVNSIAPGNVFEGSKIWNPDYIRKAAEKKGIAPEEVIPHYNSLTALKAEIKPQDIADAAVFLCSHRARRITGQVLAVDGGQVWVR